MFYEHIIIVPNSGFDYDISIHAQHSLPGTACLSSLSLPPLSSENLSSLLWTPPLTIPADAKFVDFFKSIWTFFPSMKLSHFLPWNGFQCLWSFYTYLCEEDIPNRVSDATHGKTACLLPTNKATPAGNRILPSSPTLQIDTLIEGSSSPRRIALHSFQHRGRNEISTAVIPVFLCPTYHSPPNWRYPLKIVWIPDKISNRVLGVETAPFLSCLFKAILDMSVLFRSYMTIHSARPFRPIMAIFIYN